MLCKQRGWSTAEQYTGIRNIRREGRLDGMEIFFFNFHLSVEKINLKQELNRKNNQTSKQKLSQDLVQHLKTPAGDTGNDIHRCENEQVSFMDGQKSISCHRLESSNKFQYQFQIQETCFKTWIEKLTVVFISVNAQLYLVTWCRGQGWNRSPYYNRNSLWHVERWYCVYITITKGKKNSFSMLHCSLMSPIVQKND